MVYFMCDSCAATLKKNQVKRHKFECRNASVFTCIDCSKNFSGQDLENHTSCKTEAEKYFGKFYDSKKKSGADKWKGWKNEIKYVLKNAEADGIDQNELKKIILQRHSLCFGKKTGLDSIFNKKINFTRFKHINDRVYYYRYLR
jgi:cell growth-regulating nucleolar protein